MNSENNYSDTPDIHAFAPVARRLLQEGRVEEAYNLCSDGVRAHPYYATGHYLLGLSSIAAGRHQVARHELERALELDGPSPALLDALIMCYDELGLNDLAGECRTLSSELNPRPLKKAEDEGGPEMVDEPDTSLEPDSGEESGLGGADAGSSDDALKELEALLDSAGPSLEGEEEQPEEEPVVDEPLAAEPEPEVAEPLVEETLAAEEEPPVADEEPRMEEEPLVEEPLEMGTEDEIEAVPADSLSALDLDSGLDEEIEPAEEPVIEEEPVAISTEEGEGAGSAEEVDDEAADMWKKIMEQADEVATGDYSGIEDLKTTVEEGDGAEVEAEAEAVPADSLSALDLESNLSLEEIPETPSEVEEVEGLEIPEAEPLDIVVDMVDSDELGEVKDVKSGVGEDELVAGPIELSDETIKMAAEGLDLDDSLERSMPGGGGDDDALPEEPVAAEVHEPEGVDVDEALRALEEELGTGFGEDAGIDKGITVGEEPIVAGEAAEDMGLDAGSTLEDQSEDEEKEAVTVEDVEVELGVSMGEIAPEGERELPFTVSPTTQITSAEDSIKVAIQAEILIAKGKTKDAIKLFEALHLWAPDRVSFKERVKELRRQMREEE